jgi:hypothetical protein
MQASQFQLSVYTLQLLPICDQIHSPCLSYRHVQVNSQQRYTVQATAVKKYPLDCIGQSHVQ